MNTEGWEGRHAGRHQEKAQTMQSEKMEDLSLPHRRGTGTLSWSHSHTGVLQKHTCQRHAKNETQEGGSNIR